MTTMTAVRYRKTKAGDWVAYGPAGQIKAKDEVVIVKADGSEDCRYVERVGRPFTVAGQQMLYGYLRPARPTMHRSATGGTCDECGRRGSLVECVDSSGIGGRCCTRCAAQPAYTRSFM